MAIVLAVGTAANAQGNVPGGAQLPFSNMYSRPTVSPYMQLQQQGMNPLMNQNIYQTMVQPQVQQQQQQLQQLQQARQINKMQNQVQQIQRDTRGRQIDETIRPTGHASTYQNLSHFYPARR
jgi:Ca2+-dependent lipid-binding protein